jgi:GNAT superfamily N-acetyltransferase
MVVRRPHGYTWEAVGLIDPGSLQRISVAGRKEVGVDVDQRHAAILRVAAYDGRVQPLIREASSSDDAVMDAIAKEGDASADANYLALVRSQRGRLLVAERDGRVVGYGGVVDVDGVAMLTDLFVSTEARGAGIGTVLLGELFDGSSRRMTFSSKHPAALAAYQRVGMEPQWRLLYLKGVANGGGTGLPAAPWQHERLPLVEMMASQGAHVSAHVVSIPDETGIWIARVHSARPVKALSATLAGLPRGTVVSMCVPEYSPVAGWAQEHGFAVTDHDTFCATPGPGLPPDLHCLDPGLA